MNLLRLLMATTLACTLIACGKSKEEKAKANADQLTNEYNSLAKELNATYPATSWSDDQLQTYENKISRMETLQGEIDRADGKDGVIIIGGNNTEFLKRRRLQLAVIRATKKYAESASRAQPAQPSKDQSATRRELQAEYRVLSAESRALGTPDETWSAVELQKSMLNLNALSKNISAQIADIQLNPPSDVVTDNYLVQSLRSLKIANSRELGRVQNLWIKKASAG